MTQTNMRKAMFVVFTTVLMTVTLICMAACAAMDTPSSGSARPQSSSSSTAAETADAEKVVSDLLGQYKAHDVDAVMKALNAIEFSAQDQGIPNDVLVNAITKDFTGKVVNATVDKNGDVYVTVHGTFCNGEGLVLTIDQVLNEAADQTSKVESLFEQTINEVPLDFAEMDINIQCRKDESGTWQANPQNLGQMLLAGYDPTQEVRGTEL